MVLSEQKKREYIRRIMMVRMKLLCEQGFYGLLLMHMHFHLSEENATAWYFFFNKLEIIKFSNLKTIY